MFVYLHVWLYLLDRGHAPLGTIESVLECSDIPISFGSLSHDINHTTYGHGTCAVGHKEENRRKGRGTTVRACA